ncbi:hypothetical protein [Nostoc sp.]|uniref:hypothetical protein n=1 Tax=Nostoc sp. TaxID=1180 RepID=UPI002FF461C2
MRESLKEAGFEKIAIDVVPQVPFLYKKSGISGFLVNQLVRFLPNQIAGSVTGYAKK